jgi:[acyl-carrier-protein] S-malonyltransferase
VRWQESIELLVREGVSAFVEVGPGSVLAGLVKKIAKGVQVLGVSDAPSCEAAATSLAGVRA